jgi:hypothetical protein
MASKNPVKELVINGVTWTELMVKERIATDQRAAAKAAVRIYNAQTAEEKVVGTAKTYNGVGFSKFDAGFMTEIAKAYIQYGDLYPASYKTCMTIMPKYSGQIWDQMVAECKPQFQNDEAL